MPYAKSYTKKSYARKGRKTYARPDFKKAVKAIVRQEKPTKEIRYVLDKAFATDVLASRHYAVDVTNIDTGDFAYQRTGREIVLNGFRYDLFFDNARLDQRYIRMMVVQGKNSYDPPDYTDFSDLLQTEAYVNVGPVGLWGDVASPINRDIYNIYLDKTIKMEYNGEVGSSKHVQGYVKLNKRLKYDNAGNGANVPDTSSIRIVFIVAEINNTLGTSATVTKLGGLVRCFFKDT